MNRFLQWTIKGLKVFFISLGSVFLVMCVLSFTRLPFDLHRWLGEYGSSFEFKPELMVMLGGSGMPSESNLIRLYYTAEYWNRLDKPRVLITHPEDSSVAGLMQTFLLRNGVDSGSVSVLLKGTNTREQATEILALLENNTRVKMAIVTSPENMYRTIRVFRKAGFRHVGGIPAFENAMFVDLSYGHKQIGGKEYVPDVSENLDLRYNFWNYFKLQITCYRELVAITYYWVNHWI